ncbi:hypothetical protein AV540_20840 [Brevibacillus parabrevis]|uniref:hypothetical protein n=1 Tax=Brevibacillus parabrevis TaxID=54914 RepID=UPI0007AB2C32|nr:hypothetical protein [Brevibacillus parabrevis]KZE47035.1 hypothetical protein AV540_20840 [Brevibacillus parabrevis]
MNEEFNPVLAPDPALRSPAKETQGEVLDKHDFSDLYQLASEAGLPYFARLNGTGEVELYLVFESVDAFVEQTRDAVSVEFKTYQGKLLGVIWTLSDPLQPLGFPLTFDIQLAEQRGMALRMLEQPCTLLHYLAYGEGELTHIYSESIFFSAGEVERTREMIRSLFEGKVETIPQEAQVREEEMRSIAALSFPDTVFTEEGLAFVLDYRRMQAVHGEEGAQHLLMSTVRQAVWVMRRHARSEVRESAFTVWVAERGELLDLIVTPGLGHLFEVIHMAEEDANPFSRFLLTLPEYVETKEVSALGLGAYPLLRYENGVLYHLELDENVQAHLQALFVKAFPGMPVPYQ